MCAIYRKEVLEKTPFPDVEFAEDLAWALKISLLGLRITYLPHIKVRHSHNRLSDYTFRPQIVNSFWCAKIMGRYVSRLLKGAMSPSLESLVRPLFYGV